MPPAPSARSLYAQYGLLLAILLVAGVLRIAALTRTPPGLHQDEAVNAWNAWCLLKTGHDQVGAGWPFFYFRALGENRSPVFLYAVLPFQILGGMNVWTNRLPAAVGGLVTILLLYWIADRLFNRSTALVAAALLTLAPWHVQLSRFGHDAALGPLLACLAFASLLWAGFPLGSETARPSVWKGLVAGLVIGMCCYGYPAVRLFIPIFLVACVLVTCRAWWRWLRQGGAPLAAAGLVIGVGVTFGPLLYCHVTHPEIIGKRGESTALWPKQAPLRTKAAAVAERYVVHFDPAFLFIYGNHEDLHSMPHFGEYQWYTLPLLLIGLVVSLAHVVKSHAARLALCWVLLYPAGDCLHRHLYRGPDGLWHQEGNPLRSAPGLCGPILLAAVGGAAAGRALWRKNHATATAVFAVFGLAAAGLDGRCLWHYFQEHRTRPTVYEGFQAGLFEAYQWLRPRLDATDAVWISASGTNTPWVVALVALGYDPQQWFRDEREIREINGWDTYTRIGKLHFVYDERSAAWLKELRDNGRIERVVFIVPPSQARQVPPEYTVREPNGAPEWLIYTAEQ